MSDIDKDFVLVFERAGLPSCFGLEQTSSNNNLPPVTLHQPHHLHNRLEEPMGSNLEQEQFYHTSHTLTCPVKNHLYVDRKGQTSNRV